MQVKTRAALVAVVIENVQNPIFDFLSNEGSYSTIQNNTGYM